MSYELEFELGDFCIPCIAEIDLKIDDMGFHHEFGYEEQIEYGYEEIESLEIDGKAVNFNKLKSDHQELIHATIESNLPDIYEFKEHLEWCAIS